MRMRIVFVVPSSAFSPECHNKWYAAAHCMGSDGDTVVRYLNPLGEWQNFTHYFENGGVLIDALMKCEPPDFSLSADELHWRQMMREDVERGFASLDDDFDDPLGGLDQFDLY